MASECTTTSITTTIDSDKPKPSEVLTPIENLCQPRRT